ncbi:MAG: NUDIX domain-containing protein [Bacilli bacterium]
MERHWGYYIMLTIGERLLVIQRQTGVFQGVYDLPGGELIDGEDVMRSILRHVVRQTGFVVSVENCVGVADWTFARGDKEKTYTHYIGSFYCAKIARCLREEQLTWLLGDVSYAADFVPLDKLHPGNASPFVLRAVDYVRTGELDWRSTHMPFGESGVPTFWGRTISKAGS